MAENKTINIKINSNTKEATKDTKDYNQAIGSTKKQYDAVLKSGDSYEKQLSDINKIVKETPSECSGYEQADTSLSIYCVKCW